LGTVPGAAGQNQTNQGTPLPMPNQMPGAGAPSNSAPPQSQVPIMAVPMVPVIVPNDPNAGVAPQ